MNDQEIHEQIKEAERINEKFTSTSLPYNGTTLSYTTNPQAIYTSRLLSFENLPEPKNDYSVSIEPIDFTEEVKEGRNGEEREKGSERGNLDKDN
ncbi:unnamed protein product [Rhizophagus irregularis]|nr:unnamed protein product [Rhizophagus irregularis]